MKIFALRDTRAGFFHRPFVARSTNEALRNFASLVTDSKESPLTQYPGDFDLFELGSYDEQQGLISVSQHILLANGKEFVVPLSKMSDLPLQRAVNEATLSKTAL